jgi:diaminopimelate epimerase
MTLGVSTFYKASGAGNDFVLLPGAPSAPSAGQIRSWCRRALSIGADGVIALSPIDGGARMTHWNADGGRSDLCLNGSRCAARLAFELGWGTADSEGERLHLETDAGQLDCRRRRSAEVTLGLPASMVGEPVARSLEIEERRFAGHLVRIGVPHFVLPWPNLAELPIDTLGAALRSHRELGEEGANVDFVRQRDAGLDLRTFERGVEGETLACGTGAVAAAVVAVATGQISWPVVAMTAGGFELTIDGDPGLPPGRLWLAGDARLVYRGEFLPGAENLPEPPSWSPAASR